MSGGVDSSVAAALLREEGRSVIGITLRLWEEELPGVEMRANSCCAYESVNDARRVAQILDIPHYVINVRQEFRNTVVNYFINEYRQGRTPNPCVICNRQVKFAALLKKAAELEAGFLATGHYARVEYSLPGGRYLLKKGGDPRKDQSYMLYNLTQEQLAKCLFPLGKKQKEQVRQKAASLGLTVAEKKESQEVCFIPGSDYRDFLKRSGIHPAPGPIVNRSGKVLGTHRGIAFYTVGQRKGLGLSASRPLYVLAINPGENTLLVGGKEELNSSGTLVGDLNMVSVERFSPGERVGVKIRYRAAETAAMLEEVKFPERAVRVKFERPQPAVAPGQAAVFYRQETLLGGGIIMEAY